MNLKLENISKKFENNIVLNELSCEFPEGEISTVLGVSGCGKTTLLRIIAGLEPLDCGDIFYNETNITDLPIQDRNIGFVFQDLGLYNHLSVEKNLLLPILSQNFIDKPQKKRITDIAEKFGLVPFLKRQSGSLSGGEAQRLALGKALIKKPKLMLLDEPFSHLDAPLQREARNFIFSQLKKANITTLLVTHNHYDAQQAGGQVFFLDNGKIVQQGTWEELYLYPSIPLIAKVISFLEPILIPGVIEFSDNMKYLINKKLGVRLLIQDHLNHSCDRKDERRFYLLFRPEMLNAEHVESRDTSNALKGNLESVFLQGSTKFCRLVHNQGFIFEAKCNPNVTLSKGNELEVRLDDAPQLLLWSEEKRDLKK